MAFGAGTASAVHMIVPGGGSSYTDISAFITSFEPEREVDELDVTTLGGVTGERVFIGGFKSGTVKIEGIWDPTVDLYMHQWNGGSAAPFRYYPQGTATGKIYYQGTVTNLGYSMPTDVDSAVTFTAEGRVSGGWTRGTA